MKQYLFLLFFLLQILPLAAQQVEVASLLLKNRQEDKKSGLDQEDEIVILQAIFDAKTDSMHYWDASPIYLFSDSVPEHTINEKVTFTLSDSLHYLIILFEVDNESHLKTSQENLQNNFIAYSGFPNAYIKNKLISYIGNNQILCFYYDALENFPIENLQFDCTGLSIFNKFEYLLQFEIK